jgi:hypothetical protein
VSPSLLLKPGAFFRSVAKNIRFDPDICEKLFEERENRYVSPWHGSCHTSFLGDGCSANC